MRDFLSLKTVFGAAAALLLFPSALSAQCELFKSEISELKEFAEVVSANSDSLMTYAEIAGYADTFTLARTNVEEARRFAGEAQAAAYEAASLAGDAEYYAEVCGIDEVVSNAIKAESSAIDAREFADVAMLNAKKASAARKLGDVHYHMRKALNAAREAHKSAVATVYAASDAHLACTHDETAATGKGK